MSSRFPRLPGAYGQARDGVGDPANPVNRFPLADRLRVSLDRLTVEQDRRESLSPAVRRFQAALDRATGRTR